jgi:radical SAM protein with 4Fe4S-binding SPASM domain
MTSTNGHFLTETSAVEKLVNSGLDSIFISLDGISQFSYWKYRIGGKFNQVLSGIQLLVETKKKFAATTPKIVLQFLIMKHNQHEIKEIKKFKKKFKVDRVLIKTVQIENSHQALDFLPANQKYNRYHNIKNLFDLKNKKNKLCSRLWYSTVVLSDGRVVPCCFDKNGKHTFGDLSRQSITEIWNSDDYQQFREHSKRNRQSIDLCRNCTQNQKIYF